MSSSGVPYQAYRSKRHSRNLSALDEKQTTPTRQSHDIGDLELNNGITGTSFPSVSTPPCATPSNSMASSVNSPPQSPATRLRSTVRRVPLRSLHSSLPTSPFAPCSPLPPTHSRNPSAISTPSPPDRPLPVIDKPSNNILEHHVARLVPFPSSSGAVITSTGQNHSPAPNSIELEVQATPSYPARLTNNINGSVAVSKPMHIAETSKSVALIHHTLAPYRPGFQPKGVCRSMTDDFFSFRRIHRNGEGHHATKRVERTKLERRLEKLITLHFPQPLPIKNGTNGISLNYSDATERQTRPDTRRFSSAFDFDSIKSMDAGSILKRMIGGRAKDSIRDVEQRITPWTDDSAVDRCPLCNASFHPLTNRKHHCRLCGKIICALPPKRPHRPTTCSLLFVLNPQSRVIEEVDEGVDYGVRRKNGKLHDHSSGTAVLDNDDEKFLKGIRICRDCRPVLLRRKFHQELSLVPSFVRFHKVLIDLEQEIEEALPHFHELVLSLSHNDTPTKGASAARKRLLDAFGEYDTLSKQIYRLPCPNGPRSAQHRVQTAVLARASLFLQKNMFPLKSLPTERPSMSLNQPNLFDDAATQRAEDFELAERLQPLLEQEALLETFIKEAEARRKFEDVKTLKSNLDEIRGEIVNISGSADFKASRK